MKRSFLPVLFILLILFQLDLFAQQTNFQVSEPPIPWYEFSKGQKDLKINGTFLYMTGEIKDPEMGGDVSVYGGGISSFYRYAFKNEFAFDLGGLALGAGGDVGSNATMKMGMFSVPFDIEFQPVRKEGYTVILFGGFNFTWFFLGMDMANGTDKATVDISSTMRGPQGGIQFAIKYPEFVFTPFFMITRMSGDATIDYDISSTGSGSLSTGIGSSTAYYYGIDIIYLPWNIAISSIIQQALSSGNNQPYRTYVFTVSTHLDLGSGSSEEIPVAEKNTVKSKKKQINEKQIQ